MTGCATYKRALIKDESVKLTSQNILTYNSNFESYSYKYSVVKDNFKYPSKNTELLDALFRTHDRKIDSSGCESYNIQFISKDTLLLKCQTQKDSSFSYYKIAGKLKNNGFFNLKNSFFECHRIPLLMVGCDREKTMSFLSKLPWTALEHFSSLLEQVQVLIL